ncbi:MAG: hypothetical protein ACLGIB_07470, partial [Actinomycetota bacterium]
PDGGLLAGEYCPDSSARLCLARTDGSGYVGLPTKGQAFDPSWSPDGDELIYSEWDFYKGFYGELLRVASDGSTLVRVTTSPDVADIQPDWWGPAE